MGPSVKENRSAVTLDSGAFAGQTRRARSKLVLSGRIDIASDISARPLLQAALDALSAHVAVLDAHGTIVGVNRAWRRFGRQNGLELRNDGIGSNYITALPRGVGMAKLRERFREVLTRACARLSPLLLVPYSQGGALLRDAGAALRPI